MDWLSILLFLCFAGIIAGILSGLLGVGGGIVIVPVLFFVFQMLGASASTAMSVATGTSLVIIIATSLSSMKAHHRLGNIEWSLAKYWAPAIVMGVFIGVLFSAKAGGEVAILVFGVIAILVAFNMLVRARARPLCQELPRRTLQIIVAGVIGAVSVVMGIGGGALGVPSLTEFSLPTHKAVGTAAVFGFLISFPGASAMFVLIQTPVDAPVGTYGFVNLLAILCIAPLTVLAAPVGARLGRLVSAIALKRLFAVFLCISGVRMILSVTA